MLALAAAWDPRTIPCGRTQPTAAVAALDTTGTRDLRAPRGHVQRRGDVCRRDPLLGRACPARSGRDRADADRGVPGRPRLGLRRDLPVGGTVLLWWSRRPDRADLSRTR